MSPVPLALSQRLRDRERRTGAARFIGTGYRQHGNQEATNRLYEALTGSSPLAAFMSPDNIGRIIASTTGMV